MSQHFVETEGAQPQLFVFKQSFVDDEKSDFSNFVTNLEEHYTNVQDQQFLEYWEKSRDALILAQFKLLQEQYNAATEVEELHEEKLDSNYEQDVCALDTSTTETLLTNEALAADYTEEWSLYWQRCAEEVSLQQYNLYTVVFYNYYLKLKKSLLAAIEAVSEEEFEVTHQNAEDIANEFEQLKLLGLPTSFGYQSQRRAPNKSKAEEKPHLNYTIYHTDEEDADSMNSGDTVEDATLHELQASTIKKQKNKNRKLRNVPSFLREERGMLKYWRKRFSLFSRYDDGIRLDRESWFSVTPEKIAIHIAERLACDVIIDAFCGCGGNAIQFAQTCQHVIAIDIDPLKVQMARHNATVYGVADKIDFIVGDFLQLSEHGQLRGDVVFLSPPWGGPKYKKKEHYDIEHYLQPVSATELMRTSRRISENVAMYLPRNTHMQQIIKLAGVGNRCEVEHNYLDSRLVAITALYGEQILSKKAAKTAEAGVENVESV